MKDVSLTPEEAPQNNEGRSTAKQVKLSVDDLFARSEDDIIKQWQSFNKEFREEFCNLLAQTHLDKKLISQKAEVVSKAYVACVLDYRSSVVRHAIFAMDVFTQVPRDVVNKERIYSEISRLKDDWSKYRKFYEVIKPLASSPFSPSSSSSKFRCLRVLFWNMFGYSIAFTCIWITMISTLSCNAIAKVLTLQRQKRIRESDVSGMNERISINSLKPNLKALTTDPNAMMNTIGNHFNKALVWTHTGRQSYQYWLTFMTKMHRQNLRLMLIVNFIWYFTILLWWFF